VADWGGGTSVSHRGSNCSLVRDLLVRAMYGRVMCHGIISSCQSAKTGLSSVERFTGNPSQSYGRHFPYGIPVLPAPP